VWCVGAEADSEPNLHFHRNTADPLLVPAND
jgi:hypothetical protein